MARALQHTYTTRSCARAKLRVGTAVAALALLLTALAALAPPTAMAVGGDLDPSWGTGGVAYPPVPNYDKNFVHGTYVDSASRVYLFTSHFDATGALIYTTTRFTTTGSVDATYGTGGTVSHVLSSLNSPGLAQFLEAQQISSGSVQVSFRTWTGTTIERRTSTGGLDNTLDGDGIRDLSTSCSSVQTAPDGSFYCQRGTTVYRYLANGALDTSYGVAGVATFTAPATATSCGDSIRDSANRLVISCSDSSTTYESQLVRLDANGNLDTTWGSGGYAAGIGATSYNQYQIPRLAIDSAGRVYAFRSAGPPYPHELYRFLSNGTLDTSFGGTGMVTAPRPAHGSPTSPYFYRIRVHVDASDRPIVTTTYDHYTNSVGEFQAARFLTNGTLDGSYGTGGTTGWLHAPGPPSFDRNVVNTAIDASGRILAASTDASASGMPATVLRVNAAGAMDSTFGSSGHVVHSVSAGATPVQQDGMRVVRTASRFVTFSVLETSTYGISIRSTGFNPTSGAIDTTWGSSGTWQTAVPASCRDPQLGAAIQTADLSYVVALSCYVGGSYSWSAQQLVLAKFTASGALVVGFGSGGASTISISDTRAVWDLDELSSGELLVAISDGGRASVAGVLPNGLLDPAFGTSGQIDLYALGSGTDSAAITTISTGGFVAATHSSSPYVGKAFKFTNTGVVDTSFGSGTGGITFAPNALQSEFQDVIEDPSGKLVFAVNGSTSGNGKGIYRTLANGSPDSTFDGDGFAGDTSVSTCSSWIVMRRSTGSYVIACGYDSNIRTIGFTSTGAPDPAWNYGGSSSRSWTERFPLKESYGFQDAYVESGDTIVLGGLTDGSNDREDQPIIRLLGPKPPNTPTLVSPAASATVGSSDISFVAGYSDPDGFSGTVDVQVCTTAACTTVVASGTSSSTATGTNATIAVANASPGARFWRARATSSTTLQSSWTTARAVTIVQDKVWPSLGRTFITKGDGTLWVAADGSGGQFGNGMTGASQFDYEPVQVEKSPGVPFTNAIQVVERGSVYVLTSDGFVWKHGFGSGPYARVEASAGVPFTNAVQIDTSYPSALIIRRSDGTVWVLGPYPGDGTTSTPPYPVQVQLSPGVPLTNAIDVTAGDAGNVWGAVTSGGTAYTWGNSSIMLAQGPQTSAVYAEPIETSAGVNATGIVQMVLGGEKAYARRSGGTLYGWGWAWTTYATSITGPTAATDIAVRKSGGYAVDASGNLWSGSSGIWTQVAGVTNAVSVKSAKDAGNVTYYGWNVGIVRSTGAVAMSSENQTGQGIQCNSIPIPSGTFLDIKWSCPAANVGPRVAGTMHKYDPTDTAFSYYYTNHGVSDDLGLSFDVADPDANQTLTPYVKLKPGSWVPSTDTCGPGAGITQLPDVNTTTPLTYVETAHHVVTGLTDGSDYYFGMCLIDQDGVATGWTSKTVAIDVSPPTAPVAVLDGAIPPDIDIQTGLTQLQLNGTGSTDSVSYVNGYQSCVTTSSTGADCGGTPVQGWTNLASFPAADAINVALTPYTTYYVCVRAIDAATNVGPHTCSDGVYVDAPVTVDSAAPSSAAQGRRGLVVQLDGSGFVSGATATISGTGITITNTSWVSATRIDLTVDITGSATLGARNITITNPDLSSGTGTGIFTVTAPSITLALTTLGYSDAARDTVAPYTANLGVLTPGSTRSIGPAASGQTLPGAAFRINLTTDTTTQLDVTATQMTDGTNTMPFASTEFKPSASGTWTPLAATPTTATTDIPPGTPTLDYDYRLTVPALQIAGTYTQDLTWTAIAKP